MWFAQNLESLHRLSALFDLQEEIDRKSWLRSKSGHKTSLRDRIKEILSFQLLVEEIWTFGLEIFT